MFHKVFVVDHGQRLDDRHLLPFNFPRLACVVFSRAQCTDGGNVYGVCRLLAVHPLTDDNDVRRCRCAAECLVVQSECAHHIAVTLVAYPCPQFVGAVESAVRCDEYAYAALTQFTYVLCYAEIVDMAELAREVAVTAVVVYVHVCREWHVGNGKIHAAVLNPCFLEALDVDLCVGVE